MRDAFKGPILIAGFGSIGRRHLRNLRSLGYGDIIVYHTGNSTLPKDEIADAKEEDDLSLALKHKPIATFITNPTALHIPTALAAAKSGSHLFIEKPVSHTLDGINALRKVISQKGIITQVGFQFRFHPSLIKIKKLLEEDVIGNITSVQAHWGEYLPDWHPWENYKKSYSAKNSLGGGVLLTLCHPFDYLHWLFGDIKSIFALECKSGGLDIDVEDTADILLQFKSGIAGNVHLDYIQKPSEHYMRILGEKGTIFWDNSQGDVKWHLHDDTTWKLQKLKNFDRNDLFVEEIREFISCIKSSRLPKVTFEDGIYALKTVLAAKESIAKKRMVTINK
jgi:predicted dehydrogenase